MLGTGFDGEIWWDEPGVLGSDVVCGCFSWVAAGSKGFFVARRCATTGAMVVQTEPGSLFMRQSTVAFV